MTYLEMVIDQYKSKGLLLGSNLLLLHLVGSIAPALIGQKPLGSFDLDQSRSLQILISRFSRVVTTAHVLTEVSNHVNKFSLAKTAIWTQFVQHLEIVEEQPLQSYAGARRPEFRFLGLTDTAPDRIGRAVSGRHQ